MNKPPLSVRMGASIDHMSACVDLVRACVAIVLRFGREIQPEFKGILGLFPVCGIEALGVVLDFRFTDWGD